MSSEAKYDYKLRLKVSCTIITKNEADRIERCIDSVKDIVDEIIVVDSGSSDATVEISVRKGATCYFNTWTGYGPQKRYAEDRASHDWILNLDADEWLTEKSRSEILDIIMHPIPPHIFGFRFTIKHVYPGKNKPRFLADSHKYIRLYNKNKCRFPKSAVFDEVKLEKINTIDLKNAIYHQSIRSLSHLIKKNTEYYKMQAVEIDRRSSWSYIRMIFEPIVVFFKYYFLRRHITGGFYGFILSVTISALRTYRLVILMARPKKPGPSKAS